jgi:hypothetical protein
VVAAVAIAAAGVVLGLSLSQRESAQPGADVHLASCTVTDKKVMARGIAVNRTADTQVADLLIADAGEEVGTEIVVPAHASSPFSVRFDVGRPPCVIERSRIVQAVQPGTAPERGPTPLTPLGSIPTR